MSTKHTPGPWHSAQDRTLPIEIFTSTGDGDTEERIAVICGGNSAKADANALLIATAPELLSDLKDMIDLAECSGLRSQAIKNARASVAKAEGIAP